MADKHLVSMGSKSFEDLKKINEYGAEYWSAREIQTIGTFHKKTLLLRNKSDKWWKCEEKREIHRAKTTAEIAQRESFELDTSHVFEFPDYDESLQ